MIVLVQCLRVNGLIWEWWIDLPELTSIRLGSTSFVFNYDESTELIMRSGDDEMNWWIDLPKLTTLTTEENDSATFFYLRIITLEGNSYHSNLTNRHALSHSCYSPSFIWMQKNHPHEESFFLLSFIPRHQSRSQKVCLIPSFFHTRFSICSIQMSHSHFITLYIITSHWFAIPNRGMRVDVPFHHFQYTCSIPSTISSFAYNSHTNPKQKRESLIQPRNAHTTRKEHLQNCIT